MLLEGYDVSRTEKASGGRWQPWMMVSFKPAGDGFEDEGLFCHDQAEGTYLIQ